MAPLPVALLQLNSGPDRRANLEAVEGLVAQAAGRRARLVMLPEHAFYLGPDEGFRAGAEPVPGPLTERLAGLARRHGIYLHAGSLVERSPEGERYNTALVFDPRGELVARYRKIHLFDVEIPGRVSERESTLVSPGREVVTLSVEGLTLGLSLCYDLRFPELYRLLTLGGCQVLLIPSAFTLFTGKDHWEVLLRARAIENQAWVLAAAQWGSYPPNRAFFGRSMIIDPWGLVVAQASDGVGLLVGEIDADRVEKVRRELPSLANRQPRAYSLTAGKAELVGLETTGGS